MKPLKNQNILQKRLKESEKLFNSFFNAAPVALALLDKDLKYIKINDLLAKVGGLPKKYYVGKSLREVLADKIDPNYLDMVEKEYKEDIQKKRLSLFVEKNPKMSSRKSRMTWLQSRFPIKLSDKELLGIISVDITKQKKAEKKLEERTVQLESLNKVLEAERSKYKILWESIGDGVLLTDNAYRIIDLNHEGEKIFGLKLKEVQGKELFKVTKILDNQLQPLSKKIPKKIFDTMKRGETFRGSYYWIIRDDYKKIPISFTVSPFIVRKKNLGKITVFRDMTEEMENNRSKNEFVSMASHQLRTPVSIFNWYLERILNEELGALNDGQRKYLQKAYKANQNMIEIIETFLNVSQIELGMFQLNLVAVDIINIAEGIISQFDDKFSHKKIKLVKKYPHRSFKVNLDLNLLKMSLQNLLSNAIKYTQEHGTIQLSIYQKKEFDTHCLRIEVFDTGIGIPPKYQEGIFQKLFRAENAKIIDPLGMGLGLYSLQQLLKKIDGKIWFESLTPTQMSENKSVFRTFFYVEIPLNM